MARIRIDTKHSRRVSHIADILEGHFGRPVKPRRRSNPLNTLIGTLLSQNTNDRNSYRAWLSLRKQYPTWEAVAASSWQSIAKAIEVGGLKNQKAQRIKRILCTVKGDAGKYDLDFLVGKTNDEITDYLVSMKGVGKKTAACVLLFSLGRDAFPVDTHIHRICNRLGITKTRSADETYDAMKSLVPRARAYSFHVNLIHFGRRICRSNNPLCGICPLYDDCLFPQRQSFAVDTREARAGLTKRKEALITQQIAKERNEMILPPQRSARKAVK